jgi:tripartite-type tricarboxylate transporter receptor subunit TctC
MIQHSIRGASRKLQYGLVCVAMAASMAAPAFAQDKPLNYPSRPVRMVIGTTPGGALDGLTRLAAQKFGERFGQIAIVDNRPGAGTLLAQDIVANATPDGHTLLCASETLLLNGVFKRARYDVRKALTPVVWLTTTGYVLVVHPSVPAASVKEFIAHAKARPDALSYGTPGVATTLHVIWERLSLVTGMRLLHVPYKGGAPATLDVIGGQIQATITTVGNAMGPVKAGRVRGLATTGLKRMPAMADLPTIAEAAVPGFEAVSSYYLFVPAGVAPEIVQRVNAAMVQAMRSPEAQKAVLAEGAEVAPVHTPQELAVLLGRDYAEMEKTVRSAKLLQ